MIKNVIIVIFIFSLSANIIGQEKIINRTNQQWIQYYNQTKFSKHWLLLADGGVRWKDKLSARSQYIIRFGVGYQLNDNIRVAVGIAHLGFYQSGQIKKVEFRPYQEFSIKQVFGKIGISHRFRIEERYFRKVLNGKITTEDQFNFRFRYSFSLSIPLFSITDLKVSLNVGDEIFINAGKEIVYNVFDQNRLLVGSTIQLNKNLNVDLIYNGQFAGTNSPAKYEYSDIIWFRIIHRINFIKKERIN